MKELEERLDSYYLTKSDADSMELGLITLVINKTIKELKRKPLKKTEKNFREEMWTVESSSSAIGQVPDAIYR